MIEGREGRSRIARSRPIGCARRRSILFCSKPAIVSAAGFPRLTRADRQARIDSISAVLVLASRPTRDVRARRCAGARRFAQNSEGDVIRRCPTSKIRSFTTTLGSPTRRSLEPFARSLRGGEGVSRTSHGCAHGTLNRVPAPSAPRRSAPPGSPGRDAVLDESTCPAVPRRRPERDHRRGEPPAGLTALGADASSVSRVRCRICRSSSGPSASAAASAVTCSGRSNAHSTPSSSGRDSAKR